MAWTLRRRDAASSQKASATETPPTRTLLHTRLYVNFDPTLLVTDAQLSAFSQQRSAQMETPSINPTSAGTNCRIVYRAVKRATDMEAPRPSPEELSRRPPETGPAAPCSCASLILIEEKPAGHQRF